MLDKSNILTFLTRNNTLIYYIDPSDIDFHVPSSRRIYLYHIKESVSTGVEKVYNELINIFSK